MRCNMKYDMEEGFSIKLLDHGYLKYIEHWGSDERIIEAARMSTNKGFEGWGPKDCKRCGYPTSNEFYDDCCPDGEKHQRDPGDEKLLRYLWENKHSTPFEMGGIVIEVQAPILVFREWHRHRTQSYSEMSARYTPLPDVNYIPSMERLLLGSDGKNKQAGTIKGAGVLTKEEAALFRSHLKIDYEKQEEDYQWALRVGVPKELARIPLPVGRYSRMRACANLRNWLAFLTLRMDVNAQWEIRQYANALGNEIIAKLFPRTWGLFLESRDRVLPEKYKSLKLFSTDELEQELKRREKEKEKEKGS